jgi:methenyltetrahydromethanopterin cyclohydrolase
MKQWLPVPGNNDLSIAGSVAGVSRDVNERVEWVYTILPDGRRIVTGYDIIPILPQESDDKV